MKSWFKYQKRFMTGVFALELNMIEKCLLSALVGALVINGAFVFVGRNVGDASKIRFAKLQAEQGVITAQQPGATQTH